MLEVLVAVLASVLLSVAEKRSDFLGVTAVPAAREEILRLCRLSTEAKTPRSSKKLMSFMIEMRTAV